MAQCPSASHYPSSFFSCWSIWKQWRDDDLISYVYVASSMEHIRLTLAQHFNFPPWMWRQKKIQKNLPSIPPGHWLVESGLSRTQMHPHSYTVFLFHATCFYSPSRHLRPRRLTDLLHAWLTISRDARLFLGLNTASAVIFLVMTVFLYSWKSCTVHPSFRAEAPFCSGSHMVHYTISPVRQWNSPEMRSQSIPTFANLHLFESIGKKTLNEFTQSWLWLPEHSLLRWP